MKNKNNIVNSVNSGLLVDYTLSYTDVQTIINVTEKINLGLYQQNTIKKKDNLTFELNTEGDTVPSGFTLTAGEENINDTTTGIAINFEQGKNYSHVLPSHTLFYKIHIKNTGCNTVYIENIKLSLIDTLNELLKSKLKDVEYDDYFKIMLISNKIKKCSEKKNFFNIKEEKDTIESLAEIINNDCGNILSEETEIKPNQSGYINFVVCFNEILTSDQKSIIELLTDVLNWAVSSCLVIEGYVKQYKCKCCPPVKVPINNICFNKPTIIVG